MDAKVTGPYSVELMWESQLEIELKSGVHLQYTYKLNTSKYWNTVSVILYCKLITLFYNKSSVMMRHKFFNVIFFRLKKPFCFYVV